MYRFAVLCQGEACPIACKVVCIGLDIAGFGTDRTAQAVGSALLVYRRCGEIRNACFTTCESLERAIYHYRGNRALQPLARCAGAYFLLVQKVPVYNLLL